MHSSRSGTGAGLDHPLTRRLFPNAEIKRADISYEELAARLKGHGINENAASTLIPCGRRHRSAGFHVTFLAFRHATLTKVGP